MWILILILILLTHVLLLIQAEREWKSEREGEGGRASEREWERRQIHRSCRELIQKKKLESYFTHILLTLCHFPHILYSYVTDSNLPAAAARWSGVLRSASRVLMSAPCSMAATSASASPPNTARATCHTSAYVSIRQHTPANTARATCNRYVCMYVCSM